MFDVAEFGVAAQFRFRKPRDKGGLPEVENVIECIRFRIFRRVEAGVACKFKTQVFLIDPDLAAIVAGQIGTRIQVVEASTGAAMGDHVRLNFE